jgi:hypothetical protein
MVISQIIGGLGNQMFQFAAGRALASFHGARHKLDISAYVNASMHQGFELDKVFHASVDTTTSLDLKALLGWQAGTGVRRWLGRAALAPLRSPALIIEPYFQYQDLRPIAGADAYLSGYWQSEKYFSMAAADIRRQFRFKPTPSAENEQWLGAIATTNSVRVHVRRGDFVSSKKNMAYHGACSTDYYAAAILHMVERVANPTFFVFSDDLAWVKSNIPVAAACRYIGHNSGAASFNDMRLMSQCKHNIIANSSFSWWGAWLNEHPQKIVIAPARWFAHKANTQDLIPPSWVVL